MGGGMIAREEHLPGWLSLPEAQVLWLVEPDADRAAQVARRFQIPRHTDLLEEALADPRVQVVDICAPSGLHATLTRQALLADKHVLCEKPMALAGTEAFDLVALARQRGRKLMIGHHLRFDSMALALRHGLQAWEPGRFHAVRAQWLRQRRVPARPGFLQPELSGGGVLLDLGVHMIDLAWHVAGCPRPLSASAAINHRLASRGDVQGEWGTWDPEQFQVEDFAWGQLRFEGGLLLSLELSWLALQPEEEFQRVQWFGDRWGALWPAGRLFAHRAGRPWSVQLAPAHAEKPHRLVVTQFARCVLQGEPEPVPPEQIATVTAMVEALYRSAASGREEAVRLPG